MIVDGLAQTSTLQNLTASFSVYIAEVLTQSDCNRKIYIVCRKIHYDEEYHRLRILRGLGSTHA